LFLSVKKGEVYLIDLKDTYSNVQCGKRPCLVIQNDYGNEYSPTTIVVPITTKIKKTYMPVHVVIEKGSYSNKDREMVLCECILTVSKDQIINHLRTFDEDTMQKIDKALEVSLGIGVKGRNQKLKS